MTPQDIDSVDKKFQKELNAGIASLVLLCVMHKAGQPMYGYQIAKLVEESQSGGAFIKLGTLYPALRSLEDGGLLQSEVEPSVSGPPRRYYRITTEGRAAVTRWQSLWAQTRNLVEVHLKGVEGD
jgi:PadR family transcriptional regulator PadR